MRLPYYPKEESIGNPELFCGRREELTQLLQWADKIPQRLSKSRALMAPKKMGKTAILERLYNILFVRKGPVVPFYFSVPEQEEWEPIFSERFYFSFLSQYLAFKLDQPVWTDRILSEGELKDIAKKNKLEQVLIDLSTYEDMKKNRVSRTYWDHASGAPHRLAAMTGDFFLQIIDEFQFLNRYFYADEGIQRQLNLAGVYLRLAESKVAPLLVSGSYIGWLRQIIYKLTSRFRVSKLDPFSPDESLEAIYRFADFCGEELDEDSGPAIQKASRNHPFYISSIVQSSHSPKDLTTKEGVQKILNHEVEDKTGEFYLHWQEYIHYAFEKTNGDVAKAMILFLSQTPEEEKTRAEILDYLKGKNMTLADGSDPTDREIEKRLILLEKSDVIASGSTAFCFKGIADDIFNQVFQLLYSHEIDQVKKEEIRKKIRKQNKEVVEKEEFETFQKNKPYLLEFMMNRFLKYRANQPSTPPIEKLVQNLPASATFANYQTVSDFHFNLPDGHHRQFDVLAKAAQKENPSLLVECKYWEKPINPKTVEEFAQKAEEVRQTITHLIPILYSISGFSTASLEKMQGLGIAWSTPEHWPVLS